jgi:hypothetical protein
MQCYTGHRVHVRLRNIFDNHRDIIIPRTNGLVVGRSHESPILVHESDRVDRSEMLIVLLNDLG